MAAGCNGWAQNLDAMIWPGSLIVGGTQWSDDGATLESAEALETVLRISGTAPILEWNPAFTPKMACELQNRWIDGEFHRLHGIWHPSTLGAVFSHSMRALGVSAAGHGLCGE